MSRADDLDIYKIDFEWIKKTDEPKLLKRALRILKEDGEFYPDLQKEIEEKLANIDPKFKKIVAQPLDPKAKQSAINEIAEWSEDINQREKKQTNEIFETSNSKAQSNELSEEKKKMLAENEKNKGNEALKSNDLNEALQYYNKSLEYDPTMSATYCNRALINLKLKKYKEVIEDCNKAIGLNPEYIKAYHRRGKANIGRGEYQLALDDFQWIMSREPENKEVNGDLMEARKLLSQGDKNKSSENTNSAGGFKRIQIQEEDGEDEPEETGKLNNEAGANSEIINKIKKSLEPTDIKVDELKSKGTENIKKGQYPTALKDLQSSIENLEKGYTEQLRSSYPFVSQEYLKRRAAILNNMALCYLQQEECKRVIEKTTEVIGILEKCELDRDVVIKAFMRRALSYEKLDKLKEAHYDFKVLRKLDPRNIKVSQFLERVSKLLGAEASREDVPDPYERYLIKADAIGEKNRSSPQTSIVEPLKENEKPKPNVEIIEKPSSESPQELKKKPHEVLDIKQIEQIKEDANNNFRKGKINEANSDFTRALDAIENNYFKQLAAKEKDITMLYLQVLTNRALTLLNLKEYDAAINDCEKTLRYEPKNLKGLYRKALANMGKADLLLVNGDFKLDDMKVLSLQRQLYELAQKDMEEVTNLDKKNDIAKQKMSELVKNLVKLKLVMKEKESNEDKANKKGGQKNDSNKRLVQEFGQTQNEEVVSENKKEDIENSKKKVAGNLTKSELNEVTNNVMKDVLEELIKSPELPTSVTAFEKNTLAFKKHSDKYFSYLQKIPIDHFIGLFQKVSIPTDCLIMIIKTLREGGISQDKEFSYKFLESLSRTKSFDLEVMCLTKQEKNGLMEELRKHIQDEERLQRIAKIYNIK